MTYIANVNLYKSEKLRLLVCLNILLASVNICFQMTPFLERTSSNYTTLPIWAGWVLSTFMLPKSQNRINSSNLIGWWLLYLLWLFFMFAIGHSDLGLQELLTRLPLYSIPFMLIIIVNHYNSNEIRIMWTIIFCVFMYSLMDNIVMGVNMPEIYGRMHKFDLYSTWATNAGGTTHIVQCLFMCPVFWIIHQNTEYKTVKVIAIICLLLTTYYIMFINNRTTSLLIWLFMAGMFILFHRGKIKNNSMTSLFIKSLPIMLLVAIFAVPFFNFLIYIFSDSERMSVRLRELQMFSQTSTIDSQDEESLNARYLLWTTSINTFFSSLPNFLLGIGDDEHKYDFYSLLRHGVGYHSEFFDLAAKYGIIGITLVYQSLKYIFRYIGELCDSDKEITMLNITFLAFIIYSFLNNTFRESTFYVLFIFLPLTILVINYKKI